MILDSFFAFAAVIEAAALVCLAMVSVNEIRRLKAFNEKLQSVGKGLMGENAILKAELRQASKNDNRDERGRFAKADHEAVCINPASYPANR